MAFDKTRDDDAGHGWMPCRWPVLAALALALAVLLFFHGEHALAWLPLLVAFACPLMHLFHGHGGHRGPRGPRP